MNKIKVMVSSTVHDIPGERDAIKQGLGRIEFVELIGADPYNVAAVAESSRLHTIRMAEECNVYLLILGGKYGWEVPGEKRSATEVEFDTAIRQDPTKVLVFRKVVKPEEVEDKQKGFINRVRDYFAGYWVTDFEFSHQLQVKVQDSFMDWLRKRAALNSTLDYADHFIRIALEAKHKDFEAFEYSVGPKNVEITCKVFGTRCGVTFARSEVANHFWQCVSKLLGEYEKWRRGPA